MALMAQIAFYALAAMDMVLPQRSALKRVTSPPRTFTAMMAAAACALVVFFVPPQRLWRITSAGAPPVRDMPKNS
jgi:hypothetical protein